MTVTIADLKTFESPAGTVYSRQEGKFNKVGTFLTNEYILGNVVLVPHGQKGRRFYNLLRREFVKEYSTKFKKPLSSDVNKYIRYYGNEMYRLLQDLGQIITLCITRK